MTMLGIDVGSSSVKAAILKGDRIISQTYVPYPSRMDGRIAEVGVEVLLRALANAIGGLGQAAREVDWINFATMGPSWAALDRHGRALTPIVTHQDRRSVEQAHELERRVGVKKLLRLAGNRPFPGGISSTTALWFFQNQPHLMKKAALVGHVSTLLIRRLTGQRRIDPSHASFMGLYETTRLGGWNPTLCEAAQTPMHVLPDIIESDQIAGQVRSSVAKRFNLRAGTPVLGGMMDGSSTFYLTDLHAGQMVNVVGSTDVLALLTKRPEPSAHVLTRALGCGKRWLSVSTLAASGSTISWVGAQFFADLTMEQFWDKIRTLARLRRGAGQAVGFEPYLAGDRMSIEQRLGAITHLSLSSTREQILRAVVDALSEASVERLTHLRQTGQRIRPDILVTGGEREGMDRLLRARWPRHWRYRGEQDATVRGLGRLTPRP